MSPKKRFQVMLEPAQLTALRAVEERTGAAVGEQIRRAIDHWLESTGVTKTERKRPASRKRS